MEASVDLFLIVVAATVVLLLLLVFIISMLFVYQRRQLHYAFEMKRAKEEFAREILKAQLEIKEETLKHVAQELHDNLGQVLSLVNLNLSAIELEDKHPSKGKLESMLNLMGNAIREVRDLSHTLDPDRILKEGLKNSIEREVILISKTGVFQCSFQVEGQEQKLNASQEVVVFRIVQESLNNAMKHSQAKSIHVFLRFTEDQLTISIEDDGNGFDSTIAGEPEEGSGLKNIRSRSKLIGANLSIESHTGKGTQVTLALPLTIKTIVS